MDARSTLRRSHRLCGSRALHLGVPRPCCRHSPPDSRPPSKILIFAVAEFRRNFVCSIHRSTPLRKSFRFPLQITCRKIALLPDAKPGFVPEISERISLPCPQSIMLPSQTQSYFISFSEPSPMCKSESRLLENRSDFRYDRKPA